MAMLTSSAILKDLFNIRAALDANHLCDSLKTALRMVLDFLANVASCALLINIKTYLNVKKSAVAKKPGIILPRPLKKSACLVVSARSEARVNIVATLRMKNPARRSPSAVTATPNAPTSSLPGVTALRATGKETANVNTKAGSTLFASGERPTLVFIDMAETNSRTPERKRPLPAIADAAISRKKPRSFALGSNPCSTPSLEAYSSVARAFNIAPEKPAMFFSRKPVGLSLLTGPVSSLGPPSQSGSLISSIACPRYRQTRRQGRSPGAPIIYR